MTSRRTFLKSSAATALLSLTSFPAKPQEKQRTYSLVAREAAHAFDGATKSDLWLYNSRCPGPTISAKQGDTLTINFKNYLKEPTTIHWHGIRNLNSMDGVPDLTQPPIEPGESFVYQFPLRDAGTFWYHAHNKAWEQVARGLYGPLIVQPSIPAPMNRDIAIVADDWLLREDLQIHENTLGNLHDWSHAGRLGNSLTINGRFLPKIKIPHSGPTRLRVINAANARPFVFKIKGDTEIKIIAVDGSPCSHFVPEKITVGPGQRVDLFTEDCSKLEELQEVSTGQAYVAANFIRGPANADNRKWSQSETPYYSFPNIKDAKLISIRMQGGAMGNLGSAEFAGQIIPLRELAMKESKLWAFNGKIGGYTLNLAEVSVGDTVKLDVWNDSAWPHAMHLHGHHFWVDSKEFGLTARQMLRDTYLMQPGERATLVFIADNPGQWLFHCHMLEHHAAGMGGVISVRI